MRSHAAGESGERREGGGERERTAERAHQKTGPSTRVSVVVSVASSSGSISIGLLRRISSLAAAHHAAASLRSALVSSDLACACHSLARASIAAAPSFVVGRGVSSSRCLTFLGE